MSMAGKTNATGAAGATAKKPGKLKIVLAVIVVLLILGAAAYFLMNPTLTPEQQKAQFTTQVSALKNSSQDLSQFYQANAQSYKMPVNQSWSIQATDRDQATGITIGQVTLTWNGTSKSLSIQSGIVDTGISPTYAVTLPTSEFVAFSQAIVTKNTAAAVAYYSEYYLTGKINYTQVK